MSLECAKRGASILVLLDIHPPSLGAVKQEVLKVNGKTRVFECICDVSSIESVTTVADQIKKDLGEGGIDILINNAGIVMGKRLVELSPQQATKTIGVNTLGCFYILQSLLPDMIEYTRKPSVSSKGTPKRGCIVTIASVMGMFTVSQLSDYSASKFAAFGMHESLRMELREIAPHLQTLLICPYGINTGMFEGTSTGKGFIIRLQNLLYPLLEPDFVVQKIIDGIEHGESWIVMPSTLRILPYIFRFLPPEVYDVVMECLGAQDSMKTFKGRPPAKKTE
eukprot:CAMPEP_0201518640 /NCGR_PEP_ID=MMETSP0161_2-20130828/9428_1 /ASSEMBLY_ACC=CAM_ASM_000251 /TAXON_ID=180227 /ORGANISM="Neoparamoeba aestuarina, Strain SoJaBio B1-5/56/2" /LENGTH=279 /DNA_ID=CAMNT_0047916467 /DNA_START=212 /DNA_END=1051 /DNA_ORIENTATION=+